jgi:hypothetical protein
MQYKKLIRLALLLISPLALIGAGCGSETNSGSGNGGGLPPIDDRYIGTIERDEALDEYWVEIKDYLNGTETVEACSQESGNCYDLDADISHGEIETLFFSEGGHLNFSADLDRYGEADDTDDDGGSWDFTLDMDSGIVDDAIEEWAADNDWTIE